MLHGCKDLLIPSFKKRCPGDQSVSVGQSRDQDTIRDIEFEVPKFSQEACSQDVEIISRDMSRADVLKQQGSHR